MKVGGGPERFMLTLPLFVAAFMTVYWMGGPDRALSLLEKLANDAWLMVANMLR